jgi:hypothetical protein
MGSLAKGERQKAITRETASFEPSHNADPGEIDLGFAGVPRWHAGGL